MSPAISTTFDFERLAVTLAGKTYDAYGQATVVADRRTWRVLALSAELAGVRLTSIAPGTSLFEQLRVSLHRQCGAEIAERLNAFVEERGGYEILFGEAMPVDRFERARPGSMPAAGPTVWRDAA